MKMSYKERLLNAIKGREVDRLAWSPLLEYFWQSLPSEIQKKGQYAFLKEIGADPLLRGYSHRTGKIYRVSKKDYDDCIVTNKGNDKEMITLYETPIGTLTARSVYADTSKTWFLVDHPVKTKEDFKILTYLNEKMVVTLNEEEIKEFNEDYEHLGDGGLYVLDIGGENKTSFQSLIEYWVGTINMAYAMMDYPEVVEECLAVMQANSIKFAKNAVKSKADAFIFFEDTSTTNISPSWFENYIIPEINTWAHEIHAADKYLLHHACGHLKDLIPLFSQCHIDMIESISPPPTGNIELWDAKAQLPDRIGLIGGIEPTTFLNSSMQELEEYVVNLIDKVGRTKYILSNSDSCPPGVAIEKFHLVTRIINR